MGFSAEQYAVYEEILQRHLTGRWIMTVICILLCIGGVVLLCWWRGFIKEESQNATSVSDVKAVKKQKIEWYLLLVILVVALVGFSSTLVDINAPADDINNKAYVVVNTDFTVTETNWWGRFNQTTYTIEFERDGKTVEISPDLKNWNIAPGRYTDKVLIYAETSEIVVDFYSKETE